jgi:hypothetical protein
MCDERDRDVVSSAATGDTAMPWKIVNLDYACDAPHLHMKDPNAPIHMRSYFKDHRVEIGLGGDEPDLCFVRATVSPDAVVVAATKFEARHVQILQSIFASLDVEPDERDEALAWMNERLANVNAESDDDGFLRGNVESFPPPTGWPYDLTDAALLDSIRDSEGIPSTRSRALAREQKRRGLRVDTRTARGPEIYRR